MTRRLRIEFEKELSCSERSGTGLTNYYAHTMQGGLSSFNFHARRQRPTYGRPKAKPLRD